MKICRIGDSGKEQPVIIDKDENYRNLSSIIKDFNPSTLTFEVFEKLKKIKLNSLDILDKSERIGPCISNPSKFIGIGLNFKDHAI